MSAGMMMSSCCGCTGKCVYKDNFDEPEAIFRWDTAPLAAGTGTGSATPVTASINQYDQLTIQGEGSMTLEAVDLYKVTGSIYVHARLVNSTLTVGNRIGVTIRRADSPDRITLWVYILEDSPGVFTGHFDLMQGDTLLHTQQVPSVAEFKVEILTPKEPITDVLVFTTGSGGNLSLQHTEEDVVFEFPELLNMGLIVDGEAMLEYFEMSPCPKLSCPYAYDDCLGKHSNGDPVITVDPIPKLPLTWKLTIPEIPGSGPPIGGGDFYFCCRAFGGVRDFAPLRKQIILQRSLPPGEQEYVYEWTDVSGDTDCAWFPYLDSYSHPWLNLTGVPSPPSGHGIIRHDVGQCRVDDDSALPPTTGFIGFNNYEQEASWRIGYTVQQTQGPPDAKYAIAFTVTLQNDYVSGWGATWESDWLPYATTDLLNDTITLTFSGTIPGSTFDPHHMCDWPEEIILEPNGDTDLLETIGECVEPSCEPPVLPQTGTCYLLHIDLVDEDGHPWRMVANMGINFDDTTNSWYWEGMVSPHPLADDHDTCDPMQFGFAKIHCVELQEGAAKTWVLDFTYDGQTERFPMSEDPELGLVWEGTTDIICSGQTWDFFAWGLHAPTGTYQFGSCEWSVCHDPMLYIIPAGFSTECDGGSGLNYHHGYLLFTPTSPRPWMAAPSGTVMYSPLPYGYPGPASGIFLYVEYGTVRLQIVDGNLDPMQDLFASVAYTCNADNGNRPIIDDTSPISYLWGFPSPVTSDPFGICSGTTGYGSWSVSF